MANVDLWPLSIVVGSAVTNCPDAPSHADPSVQAHLGPMRLNQLGLCGDGAEGVGVSAHLVVDHIVSLDAHRPHHVLALLLCPQLKRVSPVLLVTLGLEGGHADCSTLLPCPHDVAAYDGKDDGDKEGWQRWQ